VYLFDHNGMAGTYIDFPGHIKETGDTSDARGYPLERLYRQEAAVIRLDRADRSGGVTAEELERAFVRPFFGGALVINALGARRFDEIEYRSVWLAEDAVNWIIRAGIHLLASDIYESKALHGVFFDLFRAGIATVCCPINLHRITTPRCKLTALLPRFRNVTQLPCRLLAEV